MDLPLPEMARCWTRHPSVSYHQSLNFCVYLMFFYLMTIMKHVSTSFLLH